MTPLRARCSRMVQKMRARGKRHYAQVPFTIDELETWLVSKSDRGEGVAWRCEYCPAVMVMTDVELDHDVPLSRGGTNAFENLVVSCHTDNLTKGELKGEEYRALVAALSEWVPAAAAYVKKCLRTAGIGFAIHKAKGANRGRA